MVDSNTIAETLSRQSSEEIAARINNEYYSDEALPIALAELERRGIDVNNISNMKFDYIDTPIVNYKSLFVKLLTGVVVLLVFIVVAISNSYLKEKLFGSKDESEDAALSQAVEKINSTLPLQLDENSKILRLIKGQGREIVFYVSVLNNIDENKFKQTIEDRLYESFCKSGNVLFKYKIAGKWIFEKDDKILKEITIPAGDCREQVKPLKYK